MKVSAWIDEHLKRCTSIGAVFAFFSRLLLLVIFLLVIFFAVINFVVFFLAQHAFYCSSVI